MKIGDKVIVSPELTGEKYWIVGEVIDVEQNPFNGIVISVKDELGRIFFGKKVFFNNASYEPNEETIAAIKEARSGKHAGTIDISSLESFIKSSEDTP